jgi:hypothetical protein
LEQSFLPCDFFGEKGMLHGVTDVSERPLNDAATLAASCWFG